MEFSITQEVDNLAYNKSFQIQELSKELNTYLKDKDYGSDIKSVIIGAVLIKTKPGFEDWYKERKPKYIEHKITKNRITGQSMEIIKNFTYDIKFDSGLYDEVVNSSDVESLKIISREIVMSLKHFDKLTKKLKDFNVDRFTLDIQSFFLSKGLIE
ncbi:hypothetical protein [Chryseobacterium aquaticum]|nr:hypothetical protein [Chryseobacterium aquaticum]